MTETEKPIEYGSVYYTDGAAKPNPGYAGWGFHGYYYNTEVPKKGSGLTTHEATAQGYLSKLDARAKASKVTPLQYFDSLGAIQGVSTNNVGELRGAIEALKHSLQFTPSTVNIYSDSKMVVDGSTKWVDGWRANGWKKRDGEYPSSLSLWQEIYSLRENMKEKGVKLAFNWVMGHGDNPGNIKADKLSVIARHKAVEHDYSIECDTEEASGYWTKKPEKNPLLDQTGLYFNTLKGYNEKGLYYLGNKYRVEDQFGAPVSDTSYSIVRLKESSWALEYIRETQSEICDKGKRDLIVIARLDYLFTPEVYFDLERYGKNATRRGKNGWDLYHNRNNDPLTRILVPPKLAQNAIESLSFLYYRLEQFESESDELTKTDVTSLFYETVETKKANQTKTVLKPSFNTNPSKFEVTVKRESNGLALEYSLILILGLDILSKNALKKIESEHPKITIVTWSESDLAVRFAAIVQTDSGICMTESVYSNLRLLTAKPSQSLLTNKDNLK